MESTLQTRLVGLEYYLDDDRVQVGDGGPNQGGQRQKRQLHGGICTDATVPRVNEYTASE